MTKLGVISAAIVVCWAKAASAEPTLCTDSKLCRVTTAPKGTQALVAPSDAGPLWAVGAKGQASSFDGGVWSKPVKTGAKKDLVAAARMGDGLVAVGKGGQIVRLVANKWTVDKSPAKKDLVGVWASSADAAWAVGKAGTIVRFSGGKWTVDKSPTKVDLHAVWGPREGVVFAVGGKGTILAHDGTAWQEVRTGNSRLVALGGDAGKVFAVGDIGAVLRWEGKGWNAVQTGMAGDLSVVVGLTPAETMIFGADGAGATLKPDRDWDQLVAGEDKFLGWARMHNVALMLAADGGVWRFSGGWRREPSPTGQGINAMSLHGDLVVVGGDHGSLAVRKAGKWQQLSNDVAGVNTLMGVGHDGKSAFGFDYHGNLVKVVDGKPVVTKNGVPKTTSLGASWIGPEVGYAVGDGNGVAKWSAGKWSLLTLPFTERHEFEAVHGIGTDLAFLTTATGVILGWDGKEWKRHPTGDNSSFRAVFAVDKDFAVAAGSFGALAMWDGLSWNRVPSPLRSLWRSACGRSRTEIYLGSNTGDIVRWDGVQWVIEGSPTGGALRSCVVMPDGEVIFGEQTGGLIMRSPQDGPK